MTKDEILENIKAYESKWGKLGESKSIMHSSIQNKNTQRKDNKTMLRMDSDFYAYRQKVLAGKEANRLAHSSTINVTELNERYYQELEDKNVIIHAGNSNKNYKYYNKIDLGNGKTRYFYTKAEWDAYQEGLGRTAYEEQKKSNSISEERTPLSKDTGKYSDSKAKERKLTENSIKNMKADVVEQYSKIARESDAKTAAKEFYKEDAVSELLDEVSEGFKSGKLRYKDGKFETDDKKIQDNINAFSDNIQKWTTEIGKKSGKGRDVQKELEKLITSEIEKMSKKSPESSDETNKYANIAKDDPKKAASEFMKDPVVTDYIKFVEKGLKDGSIRMNNDGNFVSNNTGKTGDKDIVDSYMYKIDDIAEKIASSSGAGNKFLSEVYRLIQDQSDALDDKYSSAKHSATNEYANVMDEYHEFMERAKRGKEMNRLSHSTFISPAELNKKYYESLYNDAMLVHASTSTGLDYGKGYYQKIDKYYSDGRPRYFYTKQEWDAYQENKGQEQFRKDQNAKKVADSRNNMSGYDSWKKQTTAKSTADARNDAAGLEAFRKKQAENEAANKLANAKEISKQKSGMTGRDEYDAKQQKNAELKSKMKALAAKNKADSRNDMDDYEDWKKDQNAKKIAESRNDMSGYSKWKKDQEAAAAEKEANAKETAKQRGGMEGYDEYLAKKKEEREKQQKDIYEKNKAAGEAEKEAENEMSKRSTASKLGREALSKAISEREEKEKEATKSKVNASIKNRDNDIESSNKREQERISDEKKTQKMYRDKLDTVMNILTKQQNDLNKEMKESKNPYNRVQIAKKIERMYDDWADALLTYYDNLPEGSKDKYNGQQVLDAVHAIDKLKRQNDGTLNPATKVIDKLRAFTAYDDLYTWSK